MAKAGMLSRSWPWLPRSQFLEACGAVLKLIITGKEGAGEQGWHNPWRLSGGWGRQASRLVVGANGRVCPLIGGEETFMDPSQHVDIPAYHVPTPSSTTSRFIYGGLRGCICPYVPTYNLESTYLTEAQPYESTTWPTLMTGDLHPRLGCTPTSRLVMKPLKRQQEKNESKKAEEE